MAFTLLIVAPLLLIAWVIAFVRSIFRAKRGIRDYRGWLRHRRGLCPTCGYDLRATPDRCPECGTIPTAKGATP